MDHRQLTMHQQGDVNSAISICVEDERGPGNANHRYTISWTDDVGVHRATDLQFQKGPVKEVQKGPVKEVGVNGITNEALLAIVIDRMHGFQTGKFRCAENRIALEHLEDALHALQRRTRERQARGVEGTLAE